MFTLLRWYFGSAVAVMVYIVTMVVQWLCHVYIVTMVVQWLCHVYIVTMVLW